jgi:hypothetical protein
VAIDKSGSTYGGTLKAEIAVVEDICRLHSPANKHPVHLLPWCDDALAPITLPENTMAMRNLSSGGGTDPSVLYSSTACLEALRASGVWFLLTDGQIYDNLVENFALKTASVGLHNKSCVIVVFGDSTSGPPASCDISVGIAVYAVAPDCLFLFHDIPTGRVKIMQAKGRFKELLLTANQEYVQPLLNKYTTWAELPRMSYEDLSRIQLAPIRNLHEQEIALADDLVVTMPDLLSGRADPETVERIVKDDDNLKSIVLASMTRGTGKDLENWLLTQQKPMPKISRHRDDIGGKAQQAITQLLEALSNKAEEAEIGRLRESLRSAHEENWLNFKRMRSRENENYDGMYKHNKKMKNAHRIKRTKDIRPNLWAPDNYAIDMDLSDDDDMALKERHNGSSKADPVFLPGFQRREPVDEFTGSCMLCQRKSVLVILLKSPPNMTTTNFPRQASYSKLAFPLAMSNFAEMDIMSFFVCCDSCAFYLLRNGTSPHAETITGALCLVCINDNQGPWLEALETAVKGRFDIPDLMAICITILDRMIVENDSRNASLNDKSLFRDCARYAIRNLVKIVEVPTTLSSSFGQARDQTRLMRLSELLTDHNFANPGQTENVDIFLLRYPVPGFMVLFRLMRDQGILKEQLQTFLFQRLLFHIMEVYCGRRESAASAVTKSPIDGVLRLDGSQLTAGSYTLVQQDMVVSVSVTELVKHNCLDVEILASFRTVAEFEDIEKRTGPAMAVFLHHLSRYGGVYPSPIACFNALKVGTSIRKVILTPLAISDGLSADLISQL